MPHASLKNKTMVTHQWAVIIIIGGMNVDNSVHLFGSAESLVIYIYMFSKDILIYTFT